MRNFGRTSCYIAPGGTEIDEASIGIPGQLGINAYARCCEKPVGTQPKSFGGVKNKFDD